MISFLHLKKTSCSCGGRCDHDDDNRHQIVENTSIFHEVDGCDKDDNEDDGESTKMGPRTTNLVRRYRTSAENLDWKLVHNIEKKPEEQARPRV